MLLVSLQVAVRHDWVLQASKKQKTILNKEIVTKIATGKYPFAAGPVARWSVVANSNVSRVRGNKKSIMKGGLAAIDDESFRRIVSEEAYCRIPMGEG